MAFFAPLIPLLSGAATTGAAAGAAATAGTIFTAGNVLAGASALGGLASAYQQHAAGQVTKAEYKLAAKEEGDAARGREIDRKRNLLTALATQNAAAGAGGVTTGGSIGAIAQNDIDQATMDSLTDRASTSNKVRVLRTRGSNAGVAGNANAIGSVLDTVSDFYQATGGRKRKLG